MAHTGLIILLLALLILLSLTAYIFLTRLRASRSGVPPPPLSSYNPFTRTPPTPTFASPAPRSILDWAKDAYHRLTNRRTTTGGYEEPLGRGGGRARRGFGPLDPDEAWDSRVGDEAEGYGMGGGYYEEGEVGLRPIGGAASTRAGGYSGGGGGYSNNGGAAHGGDSAILPEYGAEEMGRGRSRSRDARGGYIGGSQRGLDEMYEEATGGRRARGNPFGDEAERSDLRGVSPRPVGEGAKGHRVVGSGGSGGSVGEERKSMFHEDV